jgi:SAM-dependent methyltransferase
MKTADTQHGFSETDNQYEWTDFFRFNPASRHRRRIILSLIKPLNFNNILDVGCGDGALLRDIHKYSGAKIYGTDIGDSPARHLKDLLAGFTKLDIQKTYISQMRFDLVICSEVIEHTRDWKNGINNLCKMAEKYLLITVPSGQIRKTDSWMGHFRHFKTGELLQILKQNNFYPVKCFYWGVPFYSLYRFLGNLLMSISPKSTMKGFGGSHYGFFNRFACELLYFMFFLNIVKMGKQIFCLAKRK